MTGYGRTLNDPQYQDTNYYVYAYPDSSEYTIGIIIDPCNVGRRLWFLAEGLKTHIVVSKESLKALGGIYLDEYLP